MEMLLPDWEKKEMNVEKAKEKAQINNLSKFSDNQIHLKLRNIFWKKDIERLHIVQEQEQ